MNEFRLIPLNRCYCGDTEAWGIGWFSSESTSEIEIEIRSHLSCLWTSATRLVCEAFHFQIALQALNLCSILMMHRRVTQPQESEWPVAGSLCLSCCSVFLPISKINSLEICSISLKLPTQIPSALQHFTPLRMGILYVSPTQKWLLPR